MPVTGSPAPKNRDPPMLESEAEVEDERIGRVATLKQASQDEQVAEVVFFSYGVVVFFGLGEAQEKSIIEDIEKAGVPADPISQRDWEVEECHFVVSLSLTVEGTWHDDGFLHSTTLILLIRGYIMTCSVSDTLYRIPVWLISHSSEISVPFAQAVDIACDGSINVASAL
jgi:uncharacterized Rmd1/YagE family protein